MPPLFTISSSPRPSRTASTTAPRRCASSAAERRLTEPDGEAACRAARRSAPRRTSRRRRGNRASLAARASAPACSGRAQRRAPHPEVHRARRAATRRRRGTPAAPRGADGERTSSWATSSIISVIASSSAGSAASSRERAAVGGRVAHAARPRRRSAPARSPRAASRPSARGSRPRRAPGRAPRGSAPTCSRPGSACRLRGGARSARWRAALATSTRRERRVQVGGRGVETVQHCCGVHASSQSSRAQLDLVRSWTTFIPGLPETGMQPLAHSLRWLRGVLLADQSPIGRGNAYSALAARQERGLHRSERLTVDSFDTRT